MRMWLVLFSLVAIAAQDTRVEQSGMGGWIQAYEGSNDELHGEMSYQFKGAYWSEAEQLPHDEFTLTLNFYDVEHTFLPSELTVSGTVQFTDPSDPFAGGMIVDDKGKYIGHLRCEPTPSVRRLQRSCIYTFDKDGDDWPDDIPALFELRKNFRDGTLCSFSGRVNTCGGCDEDYVFWHSKRMCD